jgi:hypothetical protein
VSFDIRQLRYAAAAADHGSFYRAARALEVERSTLSRAILKLERSIGMPIFERSRAGVTMTLAGSAFIRGAEPMVPTLLLAGVALAGSCLLLTNLSLATPLSLLLGTYGLFGIGLGFVNPPIAHTAVSGMPTAQAGVASAVASTSRQVGAALGVAFAGTVVAAGRSHGVPFTNATHPVWWALFGCGMMIAMLGWISNTPWAKASVGRLSHVLAANA